MSAIMVGALAGGCAIVPDLPGDLALPVREILQHTSCELRSAFRALKADPQYKRFKPEQWLVTVALSPKVDTNVNAGAGFTRKNPFAGTPTTFATWNISGPGTQFDAKGQRTGGISFTFKSNELLKDKTLVCPATPSAHTLAQYLGVGEWLMRTAAAMNVASSAGIDKPSYNTDITIKFSGNGSYTFTFPPGTNIASFGGSYSLDEQLNISMAPIPDRSELSVVSLPVGQQYRAPVVSLTAVQAAQNRLDLLGIENAIRQLQINP